ncbi:MAG: hypothetical protein Q4C95_11385 [Planctomycetia bacterium]|nr:hypothetical protein [Planctomycetia bacterium]
MSDVVSTLALRVNSSGALRDLDKFSAKTESLGSIARNTATAIAAIFAGSKLISLGKDFIMASSDAQEAAGKFRAVFKSSAYDAMKYADQLAEKFNFSTRQAMGSLSTMADILQKSGLSIRQSMDFSLNLNERAADIEAFTNCTGGLEHVTHALTNAMLGFGMMAQHLGVVVKDEMVQSQMLKNEQEGIVFATEQAAKMYARYQVILKSSSNATGQDRQVAFDRAPTVALPSDGEYEQSRHETDAGIEWSFQNHFEKQWLLFSIPEPNIFLVGAV